MKKEYELLISIRASVRATGTPTREQPKHRVPYVCEGDEGASLRDSVDARLEKAAHDGGWSPAETDCDDFILVCSQYRGTPIVGTFVVQAIEDFFDLMDDLTVHDQCRGFAVDTAEGNTILMPGKGFNYKPDTDDGSGGVVNR